MPERWHDKFYEMIVRDDGTWIVHYGRIGTAGTSKDYPASEFAKKLNEKLRKGYVEVGNWSTGSKNSDTAPAAAPGKTYTGVFRWGTI